MIGLKRLVSGIILGLSVWPVLADSVVPPDILPYISRGKAVPVEATQAASQDQMKLSDQIDDVLNQLLALPYEMRQYIFPAVMDVASVPKKIRTHPEIAVWEGKVPTVIDPKFQAFADQYLEDLNPNLYIYLMPRSPVQSADSPLPDPDLQPDPMVPESLPRVIGNFHGYPDISTVYSLPAALREHPNQGVLSRKDIQNMAAGLMAFETFLNQKQTENQAFRTGYRALILFYTDRFEERVNPFEEKLKRIRLLGAEDELKERLQAAGWSDPDTFARTADTMAKAYRAARMSLPMAIFARRYKTIEPDNKLRAFISSALRMYEALPADIRLVDDHLDQVRQAFIQSGNQMVLNAEVLDENRN